MAFRFKLVLENGNEVGEYSTGVPDWHRGDRLYNDGRAAFEVMSSHGEDEDPETFDGVLVVARIT